MKNFLNYLLLRIDFNKLRHFNSFAPSFLLHPLFALPREAESKQKTFFTEIDELPISY